MSSHRCQLAPVKQLGVKDLVNGGCHRLILTGELDAASAAELQRIVLRLCDEVDSLVLDLSRLTFMDSSGLRLIQLAQSVCRERLCEFLIVPGAQQGRLYELTDLDRSLELQSPFAVSSAASVGHPTGTG